MTSLSKYLYKVAVWVKRMSMSRPGNKVCGHVDEKISLRFLSKYVFYNHLPECEMGGN